MKKEIIIAIAATAINASAGPPIETYRPSEPSGQSTGTITTKEGKVSVQLMNFGLADVSYARNAGRELAKYPAAEALDMALSTAERRYPGDIFFERCFVQEAKIGYLEEKQSMGIR